MIDTHAIQKRLNTYALERQVPVTAVSSLYAWSLATAMEAE